MQELNVISDEIFTVSNFLTESECNQFIDASEGIGYSDAPINSAFGAVMAPEIRNNQRVIHDDVPLANSLWPRAENYILKWREKWTPCGLNERFRFYRYDVGQQFEWHYDGAYERANGERSWMTVLLYLNEGFEGGETSFDGIDVVPDTGLALFFVHQIRHKGQPVIDGRKYVLRTDVMYRFEE